MSEFFCTGLNKLRVQSVKSPSPERAECARLYMCTDNLAPYQLAPLFYLVLPTRLIINPLRSSHHIGHILEGDLLDRKFTTVLFNRKYMLRYNLIGQQL